MQTVNKTMAKQRSDNRAWPRSEWWLVKGPAIAGLVICLTCVDGCKPKSPTVTPAANNSASAPAGVPATVAVPPSSQTPNPAAAPAEKNLGTATTASAGKTKPDTKSNPRSKKASGIDLASADPDTIYSVVDTNESFEVATTTAVVPTDQFVVAIADPLNNSTTFVIDRIETPPASATSNAFKNARDPKPPFSLPKGFVALDEWGSNADGWPLRIRCEKTNSTLALVPGGPSFIGTDDGPAECRPAVKVRVDSFYMETLEVTIEDFDRFRSDLKENKKPVPPKAINADATFLKPALGVSFVNAQMYARWAGMDLPTEAEFEKAARGPTGLRTPWGDSKSLQTTHVIEAAGQNQEDKSIYGIFDLAANAKEWCVDHYSSAGHKEASSAGREALQNWMGAKMAREGSQRVVKGQGDDFSAWNREGRDSSKGDNEVGFRCVLRGPREDGGPGAGPTTGPGTGKKPPPPKPKAKTTAPGF